MFINNVNRSIYCNHFKIIKHNHKYFDQIFVSVIIIINLYKYLNSSYYIMEK